MNNPKNYGVDYVMDTKYGPLEYAKYIQTIIEYKDEAELDSFGVYTKGMPNELLSVELKCFLLLESIFANEETRNAIMYTSSEVFIKAIEEECLQKFRLLESNPNTTLEDLHWELVEAMGNFIGGC